MDLAINEFLCREPVNAVAVNAVAGSPCVLGVLPPRHDAL